MWVLLNEYWPALLRGLAVTLGLASFAWVSGLVVGVPLGLFASRERLITGRILGGLGFIFAALPALAILFWLHYPAQQLLGVSINPALTTAAILSILNIIFVGNIISAAVSNLPSELEMSCKLVGLPERVAFFSVLLPAALRVASPALLSTQLAVLHMTLFGSLISVEELFRVTQRINSLEYKPVELYTLMALMFAAVCIPLAWVQRTIAKRVGLD